MRATGLAWCIVVLSRRQRERSAAARSRGTATGCTTGGALGLQLGEEATTLRLAAGVASGLGLAADRSGLAHGGGLTNRGRLADRSGLTGRLANGLGLAGRLTDGSGFASGLAAVGLLLAAEQSRLSLGRDRQNSRNSGNDSKLSKLHLGFLSEHSGVSPLGRYERRPGTAWVGSR